MDPNAPVDGVTPRVDGFVSRTQRRAGVQLVEISIGGDDGLRVGDTVAGVPRHEVQRADRDPEDRSRPRRRPRRRTALPSKVRSWRATVSQLDSTLGASPMPARGVLVKKPADVDLHRAC